MRILSPNIAIGGIWEFGPGIDYVEVIADPSCIQMLIQQYLNTIRCYVYFNSYEYPFYLNSPKTICESRIASKLLVRTTVDIRELTKQCVGPIPDLNPVIYAIGETDHFCTDQPTQFDPTKFPVYDSIVPTQYALTDKDINKLKKNIVQFPRKKLQTAETFITGSALFTPYAP